MLSSTPKPVCFHGAERCKFCWDTADGAPPRPVIRCRCRACGRFVGKGKTICARCLACGFEPLTLDVDGATGAATPAIVTA